ncbi:MAG: hypothetical protein VCD00_09005 [Candidatus Hydrogenedentota bacterium]
MDWSNDTEQGFPPKRHKEPLSLRRDILDELSDHLAMAAEREVDSGINDDTQIRKNILNKFGNPAAIARNLWWDAMNGTIMKDWIQIIVNVVLCLGVMAFMTIFYRNMQSSNTALLGAINRLNTPLTEQQDPKVEFILHRGSVDGPLAEDILVNIEGAFFNAETSHLRSRTDDQGSSEFGPIAAGNHIANLKDPISGLVSRRSFTIYKGDGTKTIHIAVPPDTPTPIDARSPFPKIEGLDDLKLLATLSTYWNHEGEHWFEGDFGPVLRGARRSPDRNKMLITKDGVFQVQDEKFENKYKAGDRLTEVYGNRIEFGVAFFAYTQDSGNQDAPWIQLLSGSGDTRTDTRLNEEVLFTSGDPISLSLELNDSLLEAHNFNGRALQNSQNNLPSQFSWFPGYVTSTYGEHAIESAALLEAGRTLEQRDGKIRLHSKDFDIAQKRDWNGSLNAKVFSLKNAPTTIPEGYKLLLGIWGFRSNINTMGVSLQAFLMTDIDPFDDEDSKLDYDEPGYDATKPIWAKSAEKLARRWRAGGALIDLTDAFTENPDFKNANGIVFRWSGTSNNEIKFVSPEESPADHQPVWILLKPYPEPATQ